jgi:DNA ligase (NAD+)
VESEKKNVERSGIPQGGTESWKQKEWLLPLTFNLLPNLGLPVFPRTKNIKSIEEVITLCENIETKKYLDSQDIEFDWLVIKVKDEQQRKIIWSTEHHPRRAVAYKFPAQLVATQILSIDFQVWRTWIITPVANLQPVQLSGAKLQRVSLHNFDFINSKNIKLHDRIRLQRSGEVIPYIVSVIKDRRTGEEKEIIPPKNCPSCNEKIIQKEMHYYCENPNCSEKIKQQIQHFVSKNCMDIQGIWESIVDLLVENKIIQNIADIYKLTEDKVQIQLLKFPWFGDKKIFEIVKWVQESKNKPLRRLINWLGISHVGKKIAQDITKQMNNDDSAMQVWIFDLSSNEDFLCSIYGIWEKTIENITNFFHDKNNIKMLEQLKKYWVNLDPKKYNNFIRAEESKWSFSITWSFDLPREKIAEIFQENWYIFHEQPTKNTDFILIGEKAWSKKIKAQEIWITIYEWWNNICQKFPFLKEAIPNNQSKPKIQSLF